MRRIAYCIMEFCIFLLFFEISIFLNFLMMSMATFTQGLQLFEGASKKTMPNLQLYIIWAPEKAGKALNQQKKVKKFKK